MWIACQGALPGVKVKITANSHCDDEPGVTVALNAGRRQNVPLPQKTSLP